MFIVALQATPIEKRQGGNVWQMSLRCSFPLTLQPLFPIKPSCSDCWTRYIGVGNMFSGLEIPFEDRPELQPDKVRAHVTRHTSHVITRHTSHVTRHTSHVTRHTSHTSHVTHHTSHVTHHTSHVTRHTSHVTRHTSHVTHHASNLTASCWQIMSIGRPLRDGAPGKRCFCTGL